MASARLKRAVRLGVIALLVPLTWLAWHPSALRRLTERPVLIQEHRSELAPGVTLHTGQVLGRGWTVTDLSVDLRKARLVYGTAPGGGMLEELLPPGAVAAINGSFFERDFTPHGWVVADAREQHQKTPLSPHHVFALRGTEVFAGHWEQLPFAPELALQNFPLLMEGGTPLLSPSDSDPGFPRTFVCDAGAGVVHLVVVLPERGESGPTLFETSGLAAMPEAVGGFGCRSAVNLDGGPSTGFWVKAPLAPSVPPPVRIGNVLAVVPR